MENIKFFEGVCKDKNFKNLPAGIRVAATTYFISKAYDSPDAILSQLGFSTSEKDIQDAAECLAKNGVSRVIITNDNENPIAAAKAFCDKGWKIEGFVADPDESKKIPVLSIVLKEGCKQADITPNRVCPKVKGVYTDLRTIAKTPDFPLTFKDTCKWVDVALTRVRPEETEVYTDCLAIALTKDESERFSGCIESGMDCDRTAAETILRERIAKWLSTWSGWDAICEVQGDFNWGDVIDTIPAAEIGIQKDTRFLCPVKACVDIAVNQDELLAPRSVSAKLLYKLPDGNLRKGNTTIDFLYGSVEKPHDFSVLECVAKTVILTNGDKISCVTDELGNVYLSGIRELC